MLTFEPVSTQLFWIDQQQENTKFKMMIFLQLVSCFLTLHAATLVDPTLMEWEEFKVVFDKSYKTQEEEQFRMKVFMDRRVQIAEHNAKYERGEVTYKMGINKFSDMRYTELLNNYGFKNPIKNMRETTFKLPNLAPPPESVNWVEVGAVGPVKDQQECNSGFAFSTTRAIEAQQFIQKGSSVPLSQQNLVDCAKQCSCRGGNLYHSFDYVLVNQGIDTEADYPYEGIEGPCRFSNNSVGGMIQKFEILINRNETYLRGIVANIGPISIDIYASERFFHYHSGVFKDIKCNFKDPTHAMLIVGYGTDGSTREPYWLVQNSFGTEWGEKGYIRIARGGKNVCGIETDAFFPVL